MREMRVSGPVAAVAIVVVVVVLVLVANHYSSPPQKLGPVAQSMMDNMRRAPAPAQQPSGQPR